MDFFSLPNAWKMVQIGDICELKYGQALPERVRLPGDTPVYGSNGIVGYHDQKLIDGPVIIIGRKGSIGEVNYSTRSCWPIDTTYYINESKLNVDFKWFSFLLTTLGLKNLNKAAAVPGLNRNDVYSIRIPLPPLPEQQRIAAVLSAADTLCQKRRETLGWLDQLVQSTFYEMFGDPLKLTSEVSRIRLEEGIEFLTSGSRGWAQYYTEQGEIFIRIQNVRHGKLDISDLQCVTPPQTKEAIRTKVQENDLLISITADLGRIGIVTKDVADRGAYINQHLALVRLNKDWNPYFIAHLLESPFGKLQFARLNQHGVKAGLNFDSIKSLEVFLPPLEQQNKFEEAVHQIEIEIQKQRQSLQNLEALFDSLMYHAFQGHLVFSEEGIEKLMAQMQAEAA